MSSTLQRQCRGKAIAPWTGGRVLGHANCTPPPPGALQLGQYVTRLSRQEGTPAPSWLMWAWNANSGRSLPALAATRHTCAPVVPPVPPSCSHRTLLLPHPLPNGPTCACACTCACWPATGDTKGIIGPTTTWREVQWTKVRLLVTEYGLRPYYCKGNEAACAAIKPW